MSEDKLEEKLNKLAAPIARLFWRKHIKSCREKVEFWREQERAAIESGVNPLNKRIVRIREIRRDFEDVLAFMRNPTFKNEDGNECSRKLKKCLEREAAIFKDVGIR